MTVHVTENSETHVEHSFAFFMGNTIKGGSGQRAGLFILPPFCLPPPFLEQRTFREQNFSIFPSLQFLQFSPLPPTNPLLPPPPPPLPPLISH